MLGMLGWFRPLPPARCFRDTCALPPPYRRQRPRTTAGGAPTRASAAKLKGVRAARRCFLWHRPPMGEALDGRYASRCDAHFRRYQRSGCRRASFARINSAGASAALAAWPPRSVSCLSRFRVLAADITVTPYNRGAAGAVALPPTMHADMPR